MTKSEKTAVKLAADLMNLASGAEIQSSSDFSKGLSSGYRGAVEIILGRLARGEFSE